MRSSRTLTRVFNNNYNLKKYNCIFVRRYQFHFHKPVVVTVGGGSGAGGSSGGAGGSSGGAGGSGMGGGGGWWRGARSFSGKWVATALLVCGSVVGTYFFNESASMATVPTSVNIPNLASRGDLLQLKEQVKAICGSDSAKIGKLVNTRHELGWTALHAAACNNHVDVVKWLVENGADVNARDEYVPALLQDAHIRSLDFSRHMNERLDCRGWTPMHYSVGFGNVEITKYLLSHGANPKLTNDRGHSPQKYIDNSTNQGRLITQLFEEYHMRNDELAKAERVKYPLEKKLSELMVSQVIPIHSVSAAIRRRQNGWHDEDKPLVLMFLGSSGVGKTMLAKCVAEHLNEGDENNFIRVDMSEYSHKHEVSKFIGAPPGYVGYEEGGQLTEKLKKCPNAVVLLDEVEKAHTDLLTIMLQVFDEGRLTDGKGNTVDCRNAIFIMTSNLVQDEIHTTQFKIRPQHVSPPTLGKSKSELVYDDVNEAVKDTKKFVQLIVQPILKRHFKRDEFLGRINEFVVFHPFNEADLESIVTSELNKWKTRALTRHNINITWDKEIIPLLAEGFNPSYGFRSIKHEVEKQVINTVAAGYESDQIKVGHTVELGLDADKQSIIVKNITKPSEPSTPTKKGFTSLFM